MMLQIDYHKYKHAFRQGKLFKQLINVLLVYDKTISATHF